MNLPKVRVCSSLLLSEDRNAGTSGSSLEDTENLRLRVSPSLSSD